MRQFSTTVSMWVLSTIIVLLFAPGAKGQDVPKGYGACSRETRNQLVEVENEINDVFSGATTRKIEELVDKEFVAGGEDGKFRYREEWIRFTDVFKKEHRWVLMSRHASRCEN